MSIVERFSKKTILKKVETKTAAKVSEATIAGLKSFLGAIFTITADNVLTLKSITIFGKKLLLALALIKKNLTFSHCPVASI